MLLDLNTIWTWLRRGINLLDEIIIGMLVLLTLTNWLRPHWYTSIEIINLLGFVLPACAFLILVYRRRDDNTQGKAKRS